MKHFKNTLIAAGILVVAGLSPDTLMAGQTSHQNADGGVTSAAGRALQGADGGGFSNGRRISTDGAGNASAVSGATGTTAKGGKFKRNGQFTRSTDGAVSRQGSAEASGQQGSFTTSGTTGKNADGSVSIDHSSETTNAKTGVTANSSTTYSSAQGVSHNAVCTDSSGASVACPSR